MSNGQKIIAEFIEKYKELECLWKVSDKDYRNKHKRSIALMELVQIMKKIDTNANVDTVTRKINTIRSCFNKEHKKVKASYQTRNCEDVHVPKLWYYNRLLFLIDIDETDRSSDVDALLTETSPQSPEYVEGYTERELDSPDYQSTSTNVSQQDTEDTSDNPLKIKREANEVQAKMSNRLDSFVPKSRPTYNAFGEHIAEQLRSMPRETAIICEKVINEAIFHANFGNLNHTSRIVTDYPKPSSSIHFQSLSPETKKRRVADS